MIGTVGLQDGLAGPAGVPVPDGNLRSHGRREAQGLQQLFRPVLVHRDLGKVQVVEVRRAVNTVEGVKDVKRHVPGIYYGPVDVKQDD